MIGDPLDRRPAQLGGLREVPAFVSGDRALEDFQRLRRGGHRRRLFAKPHAAGGAGSIHRAPRVIVVGQGERRKAHEGVERGVGAVGHDIQRAVGDDAVQNREIDLRLANRRRIAQEPLRSAGRDRITHHAESSIELIEPPIDRALAPFERILAQRVLIEEERAIRQTRQQSRHEDGLKFQPHKTMSQGSRPASSSAVRARKAAGRIASSSQIVAASPLSSTRSQSERCESALPTAPFVYCTDVSKRPCATRDSQDSVDPSTAAKVSTPESSPLTARNCASRSGVRAREMTKVLMRGVNLQFRMAETTRVEQARTVSPRRAAVLREPHALVRQKRNSEV